jgi:hypothetical protein
VNKRLLGKKMSVSKEEFESLIPELPDWNNGDGIDVDTWISCAGNYEHAIGYSRIFWPEFVEHDDCIFQSGFSIDSYDGFMEQSGGHKKSVESVMNHWHISELFCDGDTIPSHKQAIYMGRILKDLWSTKLMRDFPSRNIVVNFSEGPHEDLIDYVITYYQQSQTG